MKTISLFIFLHAAYVVSPVVADTRVTDIEQQKGFLAERYLYPLDDHNGCYPLDVYNNAKRAGFSDNNIRFALLERIHQKNWPKERRAPCFAINAAHAALDIFRGDPLVEKTVLEANRQAPDHYLPEYAEIAKRGIMWSAIAGFGSDELVEEFKEANRDYFAKLGTLDVFDRAVNSRPRFKRDVFAEAVPQTGASSGSPRQFPSARFKPDVWRPESSNVQRGAGVRREGDISIATGSGRSQVWWSLSLGVAGFLASCWGGFRKKRIWLIAGITLVAGGGGLYFLRPHSATAPSSPDGIPQMPSGGNTEPQGTTPARFKPDAWRPARPNFPAPGPRERTASDILLDEVRQLMAPFYAADPQDRAGNQRAKEAAAMKLLGILKKGMPKGCREDNWLGVVGQIIGCQSFSSACMDRTMEMIGKWIGNPQRTEVETTTA